MATKVFSSRVDADRLAFADAVAQRDCGLSYGQYCGTVLLDAIQAAGRMPELTPQPSDGIKQRAADFIKGFSQKALHPEVGRLSDQEVRDLVASRYE